MTPTRKPSNQCLDEYHRAMKHGKYPLAAAIAKRQQLGENLIREAVTWAAQEYIENDHLPRALEILEEYGISCARLHDWGNEQFIWIHVSPIPLPDWSFSHGPNGPQ